MTCYVIAESPSFAHQIRPILSDRCFECHGPGAQESDLRLDTYEGATEWVITPGDAENSELLARVLSTDEEMAMPPSHSHKPRLTEEEIDMLRQWINAGAEYEKHWAFTSLSPSEQSESSQSIDIFIQDRLDSKGLKMQSKADRRTLARRLSLDLTGLPMSPEEVRQFVSSDNEDAYELLVDQLLESPHYGEHMARFWLDAVRYADTHGLHLDNYREIWLYRDWVVNAFNQNQPYDQFLVEQIAGDLLEDPTDEQLIATGFNRCHVTTNEGGSIKEEVHTRNVFERVDAYGTVCLGMTIGCAKCHDHKYDPISQEDYYSLFAFFNSIDGPEMDGNREDHAPILRYSSETLAAKTAKAHKKLKQLDESFMAPNDALDKAQADWQDMLLRHGASAITSKESANESSLIVSEWYHVGPFEDVARYIKGNDHGPEGKPINLDQEFRLNDGSKIRWKIRPEWVDGKNHDGLPGSTAANFLYREIMTFEETKIKVIFKTDDGVRVRLNGEPIFKKDLKAKGKNFKEDFELTLKPGRNELLIKVVNFKGNANFNFEIDQRTTVSREALNILGKPAEDWSEKDQLLLRRVFRSQHTGDDNLKKLRTEFAQAELELARIEREIPTTLIYREKEKPQSAYVLLRGQYDQHGKQVERRTPPFLPPLAEDAPRDRMGLAKWTVSDENPLTARVAVNRFWQQFFGNGLVSTSEDFGSQGAPPTHPELLDWLASDFVENGWDIKRLVKQIVMSSTYRQQSAAPAELWKVDPKNNLLARGPRHRLDGETLRDQALTVSGLLVPQLGGPPVKPPQPSGLWKTVAYSESNTREFTADDEPEEIHRRSLYTFHKRTAPPPQMQDFDGPTRESCSVRRERTNTPLQALLLMNDPQYLEAARVLAERVLQTASTSDEKRIERLFELCVSRLPTEKEIAIISSAIANEKEFYANRTEAASALISVGLNPPMEKIDPAELAAWTLAASTILNLDEVVTKN